MPAPGMQPPTMPGFAPNAMQQAMAQQAMAFMGMDPMAMMSMAARFFSQGGQQSQQETPGLKIFAGSKGEVSLAASPTPQAMTPQGVTPQAARLNRGVHTFPWTNSGAPPVMGNFFNED